MEIATRNYSVLPVGPVQLLRPLGAHSLERLALLLRGAPAPASCAVYLSYGDGGDQTCTSIHLTGPFSLSISIPVLGVLRRLQYLPHIDAASTAAAAA